jgi:excisionase family DNA binding protein
MSTYRRNGYDNGPIMTGPIMTVKEVAAYLHLHPSTVYRALKHGQLPAFKLGSEWRFNVETIDRWRLAQESVRFKLERQQRSKKR